MSIVAIAAGLTTLLCDTLMGGRTGPLCTLARQVTVKTPLYRIDPAARLPQEGGPVLVGACEEVYGEACARGFTAAGARCVETWRGRCIEDPCGDVAGSGTCAARWYWLGRGDAVPCARRGSICMHDAEARACGRAVVMRNENGALTRVCRSGDLLDMMTEAASQRQALRVLGNGWSWNRSPLVSEAEGTAALLSGALRTEGFGYDAGRRVLVAPGGMRVHEVYTVLEGLGLEWMPKGHCFYRNDSQTVGGIIANNVHHTYTPTTRDHVVGLDVAAFVDGAAAVVHATAENEHRELYENAFGGAGVLGVVVRAYLRLSDPVYYDLDFRRVPVSYLDAGRLTSVLLGAYLEDAEGRVARAEPYHIMGMSFDNTALTLIFRDPKRRATPPSGPVVRYTENVTDAAEVSLGSTARVEGADLQYVASRGAGERNVWATGEGGGTGDYGFGVAARHARAFAACADTAVPLMDGVLIAPPRFVPRTHAGKGFMAANSAEDVVMFEWYHFRGGRHAGLEQGFRAAMQCAARAVAPERLRVWQHTGKLQFGVARRFFGVDVAALEAALHRYDPLRVFSRSVAANRALYFARDMTIPAAALPGHPSCSVEPGAVYIAHKKVGGEPAPSVAACMLRCRAAPACDFFVLNDGRCWLKTGYEGKTTAPEFAAATSGWRC